MATRISLSGLWRVRRAQSRDERPSNLQSLPTPMQRYGRNNFRQDANIASCLVRSGLVYHQPKKESAPSGFNACLASARGVGQRRRRHFTSSICTL